MKLDAIIPQNEDLSQHLRVITTYFRCRIIFVRQHFREMCAYFFVLELIRDTTQTMEIEMAKAAKKAKKAKKAPAKKAAKKKR